MAALPADYRGESGVRKLITDSPNGISVLFLMLICAFPGGCMTGGVSFQSGAHDSLFSSSELACAEGLRGEMVSSLTGSVV